MFSLSTSSSSWCFAGCGSSPLPVSGAAAQRRLPGGWRRGELAEWPPTRSNQTPQPADTQQAAGTQTLAHHTAAHPGQTHHPHTACLSLRCCLFQWCYLTLWILVCIWNRSLTVPCFLLNLSLAVNQYLRSDALYLNIWRILCVISDGCNFVPLKQDWALYDIYFFNHIVEASTLDITLFISHWGNFGMA